ncbi:MAG: hypothetical protein Q7U34_02320 [Anaerolineales bacterium]|nr:hypothetical protein [Anaerolineales bacterium]
MQFEIIGDIANIETIAAGSSIRILPLLHKRYGPGRWRKLKGVATVRLFDSTVRIAEVRWFEAHGIGRRKMRIKRFLDLLSMNMNKQKPTPHFAICINTDDPDLLTPRTVYKILPDESAAKSNYVRVIDNEGEDYLSPADYFVFVDFPQAIQRTLLRVSNPYFPGVSVGQKVSTARQRKAEQRAG